MIEGGKKSIWIEIYRKVWNHEYIYCFVFKGGFCLWVWAHTKVSSDSILIFWRTGCTTFDVWYDCKIIYMLFKAGVNFIYTLYKWLVGFYGISTLVGYLMPNPVYTYTYALYMICKQIVCR